MSRVFHAARLVLAWGLTRTALLYAWGYALVKGMLDGRPEPAPLIALAGGVAAVLLLTAGLPAAWPAPRLHCAAVAVAGSWVVLNAALFWSASGDLIPLYPRQARSASAGKPCPRAGAWGLSAAAGAGEVERPPARGDEHGPAAERQARPGHRLDGRHRLRHRPVPGP